MVVGNLKEFLMSVLFLKKKKKRPQNATNLSPANALYFK